MFGIDENLKIRSKFSFPSNNLNITSIDIQSVEPVDQRTRDSLQKSVQLAIEITTNSQEAAARWGIWPMWEETQEVVIFLLYLRKASYIETGHSKRNTGTFLRNPSSTPAPSSFLRNSSHIYQYVITWLLSDLNWIFRFLLLTRKIQVVIWVIQSVHDNCS